MSWGRLSELPTDRRRGIGWRWPAAIATVVCAVLAMAAVKYHRTYTPPDCRDPRTLALVHDSLTSQFLLPESTRLIHIRTVAGGYLAFRFVCMAQLTGFTRDQLPRGTPTPGQVHYTSELTGNQHWQHVSVRIDPLLMWEKIE
jgi:hypothetical protein